MKCSLNITDFSDVLIAALSDSVTEHPELITMRRELSQSNDKVTGQNVLRQMLEFPSEERNQLQRISDSNYKKKKSIPLNNIAQMKDQKMLMHLPFAIGRK